MKMKDIDFETYLKNYPTKDGYFGKYGGCYVSKELQTAFDEINKAYQTICHSAQFISELRRIRLNFRVGQLLYTIVKDYQNILVVHKYI